MNRLVRSLLGWPSMILWSDKLQLHCLGLQLSMLVRVLEGGGSFWTGAYWYCRTEDRADNESGFCLQDESRGHKYTWYLLIHLNNPGDTSFHAHTYVLRIYDPLPFYSYRCNSMGSTVTCLGCETTIKHPTQQTTLSFIVLSNSSCNHVYLSGIVCQIS